MNCKFCEGICDWVIQGFDPWYGTIRELCCQQCGRWQEEEDELVKEEELPDDEEIARANSRVVGARRVKLSEESFDRLNAIVEEAKRKRKKKEEESRADLEYIESVRRALDDRKYWGDSPASSGTHDRCYEMVERLLGIIDRLKGRI